VNDQELELGRTGRQGLLDLVVTLRREHAEMAGNLTATQQRCTQLIQSNRALRLLALEPVDTADVQLKVLGEVVAERHRQDEKWGSLSEKDFKLPDGTRLPGDVDYAEDRKNACKNAAAQGLLTWRHILDEEVAEANAESDSQKLREN
jgi:hypothetical protein